MAKNKKIGLILIGFGAIGFIVELFSFTLIQSGCFGGSNSKILIYSLYVLLIMIGIRLFKEPAGNTV